MQQVRAYCLAASPVLRPVRLLRAWVLGVQAYWFVGSMFRDVGCSFRIQSYECLPPNPPPYQLSGSVFALNIALNNFSLGPRPYDPLSRAHS